MEEDTEVYQQLLKLSAIKAEENFEEILTLLWKTRKTGLSPHEKSLVQSLLSLPSVSGVDPVLACLRLLIRKWVRQNYDSNDILKLLPPDLPQELQRMLIKLLQKYETQWKAELSSDQHLTERTRLSNQVNTSLPPPLVAFSAPEISGSLWPQQDDTISLFNNHRLVASGQIIAESNVSHFSRLPLQQDVNCPRRMGIPCFKSMTWTVENHVASPEKRVAIIALKLQDCTRSPLEETEVKFQLTRDTLEAMLRSMVYISEQLSSSVRSSEPLSKKQRQ